MVKDKSYEALLDAFFSPNKKTSSGAKIDVTFDCSVSREQGRFLYDTVKSVAPSRCLEIGLAWGGSALHILAALEEIGAGQHTAIDPFQEGVWSGVALEEIKRLEIDNRFSFISKRSDIALPHLEERGEKFQLIFIDGDHRFDGAFVDFHYSQRLLDIEGLLIFDDCQSEPIKVVIAFVRTNFANMIYEGMQHGRFATFRKMSLDERGDGDNHLFCSPFVFSD